MVVSFHVSARVKLESPLEEQQVLLTRELFLQPPVGVVSYPNLCPRLGTKNCSYRLFFNINRSKVYLLLKIGKSNRAYYELF